MEMTHQKKETVRALIKSWVERREGMGWKPKSATHAKHALEFFLGAHALMLAQGQEGIEGLLFMLSVGRDPAEFFKEQA